MCFLQGIFRIIPPKSYRKASWVFSLNILFSDEPEVVIILAFVEEHIGKLCIRMLLSRMSDQKQLAVYIHPVTDLEIEEIIEVGQSHGFSREPDLNWGLPGNNGFPSS